MNSPENKESKEKKTPIGERIDQTFSKVGDMYAKTFFPFYTGAALLTGLWPVAALFAGVAYYSQEKKEKPKKVEKKKEEKKK